MRKHKLCIATLQFRVTNLENLELSCGKQVTMAFACGSPTIRDSRKKNHHRPVLMNEKPAATPKVVR
jgi:hypothetical protein